MTQEEKAKRYDEAIEIARQIHDADRVSGIELTTCEEIFPELVESEGERIRKEIIYHIQNCDDTIDEETGKRMLDWLEKQGEIIKEWSEMKFNNIQTELQKMVDLKHKTEQGEQNPSDVSKQEDIELTEFEDALYTTFSDIWQDYMLGKEINVVDFVREHSDELLKIANKQKPTEWSEEDERNCEWLMTVCDRIHYKSDPQVAPDCALMLKDWLKSLKDRVQPQNRWKPSDEQMEALDDFIYAKYPNIEKYGAAVKSLYQDLKKLREE